MRVIGELPHPSCKITLFAWNQKYLVKFEQGPCEQTFKLSEFDFGDVSELINNITPAFIDQVIARFESMNAQIPDLLD